MDNSHSPLYTADLEPANSDERPFAALPNREECLRAVSDRRVFDLIICGGGLTAAMVAHQLALEGIRVLVLETGYFGVRGVSWRNPFASILARQPLDIVRSYRAIAKVSSKVAPHLATVISSEPHDYPTWKGKLGARALQRAWRESGARVPGVRNPFPDVDEVLLTRELILAARQEGAIALSHVEPIFVESERESGCYTLGFRDLNTLKEYHVEAGGIVVDPTDGFLPPTRLGSHLAIAPEILPATVHRVYHVEPRSLTAGSRFASFELSDGSFVTVSRVSEGVVEVVITCAWQLLASETADSVARDACTQAGWQIRATVSMWNSGRRFSGTCGVTRHGGILLVHERGPWDALETTSTILKSLLSLIRDGSHRRPTAFMPRVLPGVERVCEIDAFRALARSHGISEGTIELVVQRWRGRVRYIEEFADGWTEVVPGVLQGEIDLAVSSDQVANLDDLCFAALKIHYIPGWQSLVTPLAERLSAALESALPGDAVATCVKRRSGV